jgi:hypothetical protein
MSGHSHAVRIIVLCFGIGVAAHLGGCAAAGGYPDYPGGESGEKEELGTITTKYFDKNVLETPSGLTDQEWRDSVIDGRLRAFDITFRQFERRLSRESVYGGTVYDWTLLALNGTAALVGGEQAKTALNLISSAIVGGKAAVDRNVYYENTLPAIRAQLSANRLSILSEIRTKQKMLAYSDYPLAAALQDLDRYYRAGSLPGAIDGIVESAGATSSAASQTLKVLNSATSDDLNIAKRARAKINDLKSKFSAATDAAAKKTITDEARAILKKFPNPPANADTLEFADLLTQLDTQLSNAAAAKPEEFADRMKEIKTAFGL